MIPLSTSTEYTLRKTPLSTSAQYTVSNTPEVTLSTSTEATPTGVPALQMLRSHLLYDHGLRHAHEHDLGLSISTADLPALRALHSEDHSYYTPAELPLEHQHNSGDHPLNDLLKEG